jgi:LemA protein
MPSWLIVIVVVPALAVVLGLWLAVGYNRLVRLRNLVEESWRQVDGELRRRHDLIPGLVEAVKGYAAHERGTLEAVTSARAAAAGAAGPPADRVASENALTQALGRLFAVAEAYPQLQANQNFLRLQTGLAATEDRISAGRRYYNANVRNLNTKVESFPSNVIAGLFHFTRAAYFEAEDPVVRAAPRVDFG